MDDDYETISVLIQPKKKSEFVKYLYNRPRQSKSSLRLIFAHGAGAPMDSEFMSFIANAISEHGIEVVRFEFPYMQQRRRTGRKRPPDRMPVLTQCFRDVIGDLGGASQCVVAGKSMGGRVASMMLAEQGAVAAVSMGYPFHPPAKPDKLRSEHWANISKPWLILQGSRDPFGKPDEVSQFPLPSSCRLHWLEDGDHDFKSLKRSQFSQQELWALAALTTANFVIGLE